MLTYLRARSHALWEAFSSSEGCSKLFVQASSTFSDLLGEAGVYKYLNNLLARGSMVKDMANDRAVKEWVDRGIPESEEFDGIDEGKRVRKMDQGCLAIIFSLSSIGSLFRSDEALVVSQFNIFQ